MYINCICFAACLCGSMDVIRDHVLSPKRIGCSTNMHVCTVMGRPDLERIQTPELKNNKKIQNLAEIPTKYSGDVQRTENLGSGT